MNISFFFHIRTSDSGDRAVYRSSGFIFHPDFSFASLIQNPSVYHQSVFPHDLFSVNFVFHQTVCTEFFQFSGWFFPDTDFLSSIDNEEFQFCIFSGKFRYFRNFRPETGIDFPQLRKVFGNIRSVMAGNFQSRKLFPVSVEKQFTFFPFFCIGCPATQDQRMRTLIIIFLFIYTPKYLSHFPKFLLSHDIFSISDCSPQYGPVFLL